MNDRVQARKMVLVSAMVMAGISVYRASSQGETQLYKRLWATGVIWFILSLVADFAPTVAGPFAVLVVLGMVSNGGDKAIQGFLGSVSSKTGGTTASSGVHTAAGGTSTHTTTGIGGHI